MKLTLNHLAALAISWGGLIILVSLLRLNDGELTAGLTAGGGFLTLGRALSGRPNTKEK